MALGLEGFAAAAGALDIRVVELEAFVESVPGEIQLCSIDVGQALGVHQDLDAVALEDHVFRLQGVGYLAGGLIFGVALYRARVLFRWAAVLLAVSGLVSAALAVMPDAFYRLLAYPNAIALIALGYSLWRTTGTTDTDPARTAGTTRGSRVTTAGAE